MARTGLGERTHEGRTPRRFAPVVEYLLLAAVTFAVAAGTSVVLFPG